MPDVRCKWCGHYTAYVDPDAGDGHPGENACERCYWSFPAPDFLWDSVDGLAYSYYRGSMMDAGLMSYRARPLNGIAFTAPFGNVGAWPTLADVLEKEADRPVMFPVRPRSFDPKRVGIDTSPARAGEKLFMFDATKTGNRNTGHLYGVDLPADEKDAIVEYMKSI